MLSVTNFRSQPDHDRQGKIEEHSGDSSEIIVDEALSSSSQGCGEGTFLHGHLYGTPHDPWVADDADKKPFTQLSAKAQEHYGELVAMDRSIGTLRAGLRKLEIDKNTLVWFTRTMGVCPVLIHRRRWLRGFGDRCVRAASASRPSSNGRPAFRHF